MDKKILSFSINQLKDDLLEKYIEYIKNNISDEFELDEDIINDFISKLSFDKKIKKKTGILDDEKMKEIEERFNRFKRKSKFLKEIMIDLELKKTKN